MSKQKWHELPLEYRQQLIANRDRKYQEAVSRRREQRKRVGYQKCATRLALARARGYVRIRWLPQVQKPNAHSRYSPLCGWGVQMKVPEVIDAWELIADVKRFLKGWRPSRLRSAGEQAEVKRLLQEWDRLASTVDLTGRWTA